MHVNVTWKAFNTSDYHYNIGYDKAIARDLSGAIESLMTSLRYNKKNIMSRNLLGLIYYEMGEVVEAISHFVMSVNYEPSNNIASKYLKELKKDPGRLEFIDQIAKKYNMALGYANTADYDLAIMQLKSVLGENPHFVKGYLLLALLYLKVENYEKAGTTLRRVALLHLRPFLLVRRNKFSLFHEIGFRTPGIRHLKSCIVPASIIRVKIIFFI